MVEITERHREYGDKKIVIIGAGVMGEALLAGLLRSGWATSQIIVADHITERLMTIHERYTVPVASGTEAVVAAATVIIAVKPQDMAALLTEIGEHLQPGTLVVTLAAGITTAYLEEHLPDGTPVARVMSNTPALVDEGMAAVSAGTHCETHHLREGQDLMRGCGKVISLPEDQLDAVTALSGSGPAYIFYVVEAMIEGGVLLGLPRNMSTELVVQTLYGAATMLRETGEHPTVLRERVSSPGGTTMAALRELDDHKVRAAFLTAMEAAAKRSTQLASEQG